MKDLDLTDPISHHKSHAMTPCPVFQNFTPNKEKATFFGQNCSFFAQEIQHPSLRCDHSSSILESAGLELGCPVGVEQTRPQEDRCQLGSLYPK
jgi:hypothetical protein